MGKSSGADLPGLPRRPSRPSAETPVLEPSSATGFQRTEAGVTPVFASTPRSSAPHATQLSLPGTADGTFYVYDQTTPGHLGIQLADALSVPVETGAGYAIYPDSLGRGTHLVVRPTPSGIEDFIVLEKPDSARAVTYEVKLEKSVAAVRVLDNAIEFLDSKHTPRFRMAQPYMVGSDGTRTAALAQIDGCTVNTDATSFRPAGSQRCSVTVSWPSTGVVYPALLDPSWSAVGAMNYARQDHIAASITGLVLVAGGQPGNAVSTATAEEYDPNAGSWTVVASMNTARRVFAGCQLTNGKVLVAGGENDQGQGVLASAELYDPIANTWTATGSLAAARYEHQMACLPDGRALVTGGIASNGVTVLSSSEVYDPTAGTWSSAGTIPFATHAHRLAMLPGATILLVGGSNSGGAQRGAALWTPSTGTWAATGSMAIGRAWHYLVPLDNGLVLAAGGLDAFLAAEATAEVYDPNVGTWSSVASMNVARYSGTSAPVDLGGLVVSGVNSALQAQASSELYNPAANTWTLRTLANASVNGTASKLGPTKVIVAGGNIGSGATTGTQIYYGLPICN
jgi:hypothetical protein